VTVSGGFLSPEIVKIASMLSVVFVKETPLAVTILPDTVHDPVPTKPAGKSQVTVPISIVEGISTVIDPPDEMLMSGDILIE